ncbi:nitrite reductase small subunit NirD [Mycobacterium sp. M1]|uniref:Nitrite reductase small subunit NirD n=1 Tax=Mycolicibacter acidiphilus TaxID=2835306 RepID=A0ABS5RGC0_9MYCO|nr:nitrite reductase small subunit NirD [Mycolicibacter acidiphilus]MBS9533336.1 nitrite reductase small subunit NirD [Mycolicibacter acidiphilus]
MTTSNDTQVWTTACKYEDLIPGFGVAVLLDNGKQAALFRLDDGSVHAICNMDPFFKAAVLARGIVGDRAGRDVVQSPLKKQAFALDDGSCLDNPEFSVRVYPTRITDEGYVEVCRTDAAPLVAA